MYKKQLNRIALISSPILALFELSPIFMLTQRPRSYLIFILGFVVALSIILIVWWVNIRILLSFESKKITAKWKRYLFSYSFILVLVALVLFIMLMTSLKKDLPPLLFNIINILGLNTIILFISNLIILQLKKTQTETELTSLRIKNLEAEQQQLIQQLQPHFLFNALSTLKSLMKTDTESAEEYLIKLSDFLRFSITSHRNKIVPLSDELQFTSDYIELQRIRFAGSFSCSIDIPEGKKTKYLIPIYALQTLVENAIKHNAFSEEDPLKVTIGLKDDSLVVSNNKIAKLVLNDGGTGLQNLSKRYALLCREEIKIDETVNSFIVTIKLIQRNQEC
jgi:two-component system, LytTR family, sensor kinase